MGKNKYTDFMIEKEALKHNSKAEFKRAHEQMYRSAVRKKILEKVCSHMTGNITFWTNDSLKEAASKYATRGEFQKQDKNAWQTARNRGILDEICSHMIYISRPKYSQEELKEISLRYTSRVDFENNAAGAYLSASRQGILDDICLHMPLLVRKPWTKEQIQEEALKYKTRKEFYSNSSAYTTALKLKIIDEVCIHMKRSTAESLLEKNLFDIIKEKYPKAKKLRVRDKNLIENKPHIKGFDIDIYIPELRKGIEFDGKYWHSFETMKDKKPNWPIDDILNYHKIKDAYFLSKNIQILHILESNWLKNKEECIKKCLEFLNN